MSVRKLYSNSMTKEAVKLAIDYFEANNITVNTETIIKRVEDWYCGSDIADAEVLAAAAISADYDCSYDYDTILEWHAFYFPATPIEYQGYVSIEELREVLNEDFSFYS